METKHVPERRAVGQHPPLEAGQQVAGDVAVDGPDDVFGHEHRGDASVRQSLRRQLRLDLRLFERPRSQERRSDDQPETHQQEGDERASPPADRSTRGHHSARRPRIFARTVPPIGRHGAA